jgi:hypothetical protein
MLAPARSIQIKNTRVAKLSAAVVSDVWLLLLERAGAKQAAEKLISARDKRGFVTGHDFSHAASSSK